MAERRRPPERDVCHVLQVQRVSARPRGQETVMCLLYYERELDDRDHARRVYRSLRPEQTALACGNCGTCERCARTTCRSAGSCARPTPSSRGQDDGDPGAPHVIRSGHRRCMTSRTRARDASATTPGSSTSRRRAARTASTTAPSAMRGKRSTPISVTPEGLREPAGLGGAGSRATDARAAGSLVHDVRSVPAGA